jgi:hypothetical protein
MRSIAVHTRVSCGLSPRRRNGSCARRIKRAAGSTRTMRGNRLSRARVRARSIGISARAFGERLEASSAVIRARHRHLVEASTSSDRADCPTETVHAAPRNCQSLPRSIRAAPLSLAKPVFRSRQSASRRSCCAPREFVWGKAYPVIAIERAGMAGLGASKRC